MRPDGEEATVISGLLIEQIVDSFVEFLARTKLQPACTEARFSPQQILSVAFVCSPVVVIPEKTQHCPYETGVPSDAWYFLRISMLLLHAPGDTPSE